MLGRPAGDEALARRAGRGDREAFDELVRRHRERVWAVALRICRNPADAEDALQETFVSAWRGLPRFGGRASFATWLYRIALNRSYDAVGGRRAEVPLDAVAEPAAPVDEHARAESRRALVAALDALPEEFRVVALLCDVAGLSPSEAAEVLELPIGTVKSRGFRARSQLARALAAHEAAPPGNPEPGAASKR